MRTFNIGRNATNNVILDDKMVSRQHAQLLVLDDGQIIIKDLGSSNGTFVNGNKITECNLKAGDIVKCGDSFVKWTQYTIENTAFAPSLPNYNNVHQANNADARYSDLQDNADQRFSLGSTLKYLTSKIFNIGDLFKTEWDKTSSILFYILTPVVLFFLALLVIYTRIGDNLYFQKSFGTQVIIPVIMTIFYFGISQFLTLSLLSLKGVSTFKNNLLAASILSFLMFVITLIPAIIAALSIPSGGMSKFGLVEASLLLLFLIPVLISLLITMVVFVYKYFIAIGISKGISVHFTVFAFFLNLFLQFTFTYFFLAVAYKNIFDIFKMM